MNAAPTRILALDAFRGIAALSVVLYHITLRYPAFMQGLPTPSTPLFPSFAPGFAQIDAGIVPVLWFFLLSGFVITWTVDRCRTPADFLVSRISRIYPAYWASLLLTVAVLLLWPLPGATPGLAVTLVNITMLQTWLGVPDIAGVYWSLAVELMFYAYALALFALGQWRRVHLAACAWAALSLANTLLARHGIETSWRLGQFLLIHHTPFLAGGMALYQLWRRQHPAWSAATLGLCIAAILLAFPPISAALCLAAMAFIAIATRQPRLLALPPLLWLGSVSYPLYLVHEYPSYIAIRALDGAGLPHPAAVAAALLLALALAAAVSYGVERPALRLLRSRRARPPAPALAFPKS